MNITYLQNQKREIELTTALEQITGTLRNDPKIKKIILFGSLAGGKIGITSDLDLLVVKDTDKPFLTRLREIMEQLNPRVAVDILVYTPKEFEVMQSEPNSFIKGILKNGRVVYEKKQG